MAATAGVLSSSSGAKPFLQAPGSPPRGPAGLWGQLPSGPSWRAVTVAGQLLGLGLGLGCSVPRAATSAPGAQQAAAGVCPTAGASAGRTKAAREPQPGTPRDAPGPGPRCCSPAGLGARRRAPRGAGSRGGARCRGAGRPHSRSPWWGARGPASPVCWGNAGSPGASLPFAEPGCHGHGRSRLAGNAPAN